MVPSLSRRNFIKANSALAAFSILPSGLWSRSPNSKLATAHIGIGGKGYTDTTNIASDPRTEVIGLCDVDLRTLKGKDARDVRRGRGPLHFASAKKFQDYRELFSELGDTIDAVSISTPDHTHYPATLAAMELGKHVYTQKPLTHNIAEARHLMEVARKNGVVTQMGIQNKATQGYRMATHFIRSGVIGKIAKVYVWSFKDWGYDGVPYAGEDPVPDYLDWNLWLGTAPMRSYQEGKYHPGQWRRYLDYGSGTLGDMGVHIFDTPFDALRLEPPVWAEARCRESNDFSLPTQSIIRLGFKPTALTTQDFEWTWWDGALSPPMGPDLDLPNGESLPRQGAMFVGEAGRMLLPHIAGPRFFPKSIYETLKKPDIDPKLSHYTQWIDAIYGGDEKPAAHFDYSGKMIESVLLGTIAGRYPGKRVQWDTTRGEVTNIPEANQFVAMRHRAF
jgi:predicted dehydrogenase